MLLYSFAFDPVNSPKGQKKDEKDYFVGDVACGNGLGEGVKSV